MKQFLLLILILATPLTSYAQRTASNPLGAQLNVQDASTCSTTGSFADQVLPSNAATTTVNLAGTFSGTLTIRLSNNGGGSWTTNNTVTSAGTTTISTNGFTDVCADVTTYTSGTFQVTITTGLNTGPQGPAGPAGGGGAVTSKNSGLAGNMAIYPNAAPYNITFDGRGCYGPNATWSNASSTINCYNGIGLTAGQVVINGSNSVTVTFNSPQFNPVAQGWLVGDTPTFSQFAAGDAFLNATTLTITSLTANSVTGSYTHSSYTSAGIGWIYNTAVGPFALAQGYGRSSTVVSGPFANGGTVKIFGTVCNSGTMACVAATAVAAMPIGTATFVSSTQVTTTATSTAACNTTFCQLQWFTDDRLKWYNPASPAGTVDNALQSAGGCVTIFSPAGISPLPFGFGNVVPGPCGSVGGAGGTGLQEIVETDAGSYFVGQGIGVTKFLLPPDSNFSNCTGGPGGKGCLLGGFAGGANFSIFGADFNATGSNNVILVNPNGQADFWENISLVGFAAFDSLAAGFAIPFSNTNDKIYVDRFGGNACSFNGIQNLVLTNSFCGDVREVPVVMSSAATVRTANLYVGSTLGTIAVWVGNGGVATAWSSLSDQNYGSCGANGTQIYIDNSTASAALNHWYGGNCAFDLEINGGKVWANHSKFTGTTNGINFTAASSQFMDGGFNTISSIAGTGSNFTIIADGHSVKGVCTGTVTASSTLGLFGTGPNETLTTCTSTTIGSGIVVSGASRTLQNLVVTAGTGGVNASSGVVTVLRNGSASTITCTLGTGTSCIDGTHTVALTDGDLISIQFTTQAADTLANVKAFVEWTP